jgi:hypothetical protein
MRRPEISLVVDEQSFPVAINRSGAEEALDQFGRLIVRCFVEALPAEDAAQLSPCLKTREGKMPSARAGRVSWARTFRRHATRSDEGRCLVVNSEVAPTPNVRQVTSAADGDRGVQAILRFPHWVV